MKRALEFWKKQPATVESMFLKSDASLIEPFEREEILGLLPSFYGKAVLDLAAGIGRFTNEFAKTAAEVTAADAILEFTERNRQRNGCFENIKYLTSNAMDLLFEESSFDLIFVNWLFMYLEDKEVEELAHRLKAWLKPGGTLFSRETCAAVRQLFRDSYPVHHRCISFYHQIMDPLFVLKDSGSIQTFIDQYANPFHCYWVWALRY